MKKIAYGGWENCYQLSNEKIDLILTGDNRTCLKSILISLGSPREKNG